MKILVTGAAGFLGNRVVKKLKTDGHIIYTTDRSIGCDYVGDLSDQSFVCKLPEADVVVHCAAVQYVTKDKPLLHRRKYFYQNNVISTKNLLRHFEPNCKQFVHIGTSMQYLQDDSESYSESSPMQSQGVYSWSKLLAQQLVDSSTMRTATIVPCIIGGPGREGLFRGFVKSIQSLSIAFVPGKGEKSISIVHVDDVAELVSCIIARGETGKFNTAASDPMSINDWAYTIGLTLGKKKIFILHVPLAPVAALAKLTCFRILAREQLIMLSKAHVLDTAKSAAIGCTARKNSSEIIMDIVHSLSSDVSRNNAFNDINKNG